MLKFVKSKVLWSVKVKSLNYKGLLPVVPEE